MSEQHPVHDDTARITLATLGAHVQGLDRDYQEIRRAVSSLDSKLELSLSGLSNRFDSAISALAGKLDQRSTTQWGTIYTGCGVILTIMMLLGTMAYLPISRDTSRLDGAVAAILDRGVFQRQYEADQLRGSSERAKLREDFNGTILARRYDADQAKHDHDRGEVLKSIEFLRLRTYDQHGALAGVEAKQAEQSSRIDAISRRLADFIRDMGKQH